MLGKEDFMVIQALVRRGVYVCDIARQLGVHPRTVSRALARGGAPLPTRQKRTSLLDPYRVHRSAVSHRRLERPGDSSRAAGARLYGEGLDSAGLHSAEARVASESRDRALRDGAGAAAAE